jgi:hypothetical protein
MDVDTAIDRLASALEAAGVVLSLGGDDHAILEKVAAAISPLRLPAELARFYERVDPGVIGIEPHPRCAALDFALQGWLQHRDGAPEMVPEVLFPLCYESWSFLFVELDTPERLGGRLFEWSYGGSDFRLRFGSLTDWLDVLAEVVEAGAWKPLEGASGGRRAIRPDPDIYARVTARRLGQGALVVPEDTESWPRHWHAKSVDPGAEPTGATHTIGELRASLGAGPLSATIAGVFSRVAVVAHEGERLMVVDGTGVLDVWCPASVARFHALAAADYLEFDVTVGTAPAEWQPPSRPASKAPPNSVAPNPRRLAFVDWLHRTAPEAVVSALRPAKPPNRAPLDRV